MKQDGYSLLTLAMVGTGGIIVGALGRGMYDKMMAQRAAQQLAGTQTPAPPASTTAPGARVYG